MKQSKLKTILGIETSCDETAAAIVRSDGAILSNVVFSQTKHFDYGGVVPEIAARTHLEAIDSIIEEAMHKAGLTYQEIDGIAATGGPGLIGGVMVGTMIAKGLAFGLNKPYFAINHLEGHALTARLTDQTVFPYLMLLVSGGHCQLLIVKGVGEYEKLGTTIDDAVGEAFDKTGRLLGFPYPAGPAIEKCAQKGNKNAYKLPKPLLNKKNCDFSFSGLKTAVRRLIEQEDVNEQVRADICASFQKTIAEILVKKSEHAIGMFKECFPGSKDFVLAGGVAANQYIRAELEEMLTRHGMNLTAPPIALCTDNAAMIAWVGLEKMALGRTSSLDFAPRPRWPLDEMSE